MKKTIIMTLAILLAASSLASAEGEGRYGKGQRKGGGLKKHPRVREHFKQQHQENVAFRESIAELSPQEKAEAALTHRQKQHEENVVFGEQVKKKITKNIQHRLAENPYISEEEQAEILSFLEAQHQKRKGHWSQQHSEDMGTLQQIASSPDITGDEAKELLISHFQDQRLENVKFRQGMNNAARAKRKEARERLKPQYPYDESNYYE